MSAARFGVKRIYFTTAGARAEFGGIMRPQGAVVRDVASDVCMRVRASHSSRRVDFQDTTQAADYEINPATIHARFRTTRGPATFSSLSENEHDTFDPRASSSSRGSVRRDSIVPSRSAVEDEPEPEPAPVEAEPEPEPVEAEAEPEPVEPEAKPEAEAVEPEAEAEPEPVEPEAEPEPVEAEAEHEAVEELEAEPEAEPKPVEPEPEAEAVEEDRREEYGREEDGREEVHDRIDDRSIPFEESHVDAEPDEEVAAGDVGHDPYEQHESQAESTGLDVVVERLACRLRILMRSMCKRGEYEGLVGSLVSCATREGVIDVLYRALYRLTSTRLGARVYRSQCIRQPLTRLRIQSGACAPP